jgi:hypothetical protein
MKWSGPEPALELEILLIQETTNLQLTAQLYQAQASNEKIAFKGFLAYKPSPP